MNESISHGGVCRTAPATPGLLIMLDIHLLKNILLFKYWTYQTYEDVDKTGLEINFPAGQHTDGEDVSWNGANVGQNYFILFTI